MEKNKFLNLDILESWSGSFEDSRNRHHHVKKSFYRKDEEISVEFTVCNQTGKCRSSFSKSVTAEMLKYIDSSFWLKYSLLYLGDNLYLYICTHIYITHIIFTFFLQAQVNELLILSVSWKHFRQNVDQNTFLSVTFHRMLCYFFCGWVLHIGKSLIKERPYRIVASACYFG